MVVAFLLANKNSSFLPSTMTKLSKFLYLLLFCLVSLFIAACGSDEDEESQNNAQLRYLNASSISPRSSIILGVDLDNPQDTFTLNFGEFTNYISYNQNQFEFLAFRESSPVFDDPERISVSDGDYETIVLVQENGVDRFTSFTDLNEEPPGGTFNLRVINLSEDTDSVDFYFITLGESVSNIEPTESSVGFLDDSDYFNATNRVQGQRIAITSAGGDNIIFDTGPITFQTGKNFSLYLLPTLGGRTLSGGMIVEDGDL